MKLLSSILGLTVLLLVLWFKARPAGPVVLTGRAMGCDWKLVTRSKFEADRIRPEIAAVLEHWEQVLSTWRLDSDLSRHNRGAPASDDLQRVLGLADALHRDTRGAFDHRLLGALTNSGFGPGGTGIDLSSVGKGFGVDRVCERLQQLGLGGFTFALAGEVRVVGEPQAVGIASPVTASTAKPETVTLEQQSLATSGNRQLPGHIIDPRTGKSVIRPPSSVSVIAPDCATASAWATALFVLGPEGDSLATARGLQVIRLGRATPLDAAPY